MPLSGHAIATLLLTAAAFYFFTRPRIRMELVCLAVLGCQLLLFRFLPYRGAQSTLTDEHILHAFGHPALIAICCLMILGRGLTMTGALEPMVRLLSRLWSRWPQFGFLLTLCVCAVASAFINDTPVLVLLLPMLLGIAAKTGVAPSKTLMPANFAILAGGMLTSVGTSTNILVLSLATDMGMPPVGVFDFTLIAGASLLVAIPYLWLVAPRLLPAGVLPQSAPRNYDASVRIDGDSRLKGRAVGDISRTLGREVPITGITRAGLLLPAGDLRLELVEDDILHLSDTPEGLREVASAFNTTLFDSKGAGRFVATAAENGDQRLVEVVIGTGSLLDGKSLREVRLAEQFVLVVVAIHRSGDELVRTVGNLADEVLRAGDLLLVQGTSSNIKKLRSDPKLMLLDTGIELARTAKAPWALGIMALVVFAAAIGIAPIHITAFLGVLAMLLLGCVRVDGLGRALSAEVVLLIVTSLTLGQSLVATGAADWLARGLAVAIDPLAPAYKLAMLMAAAALLTNFASNAAAASIMTPIAVATALQLGLPPQPFALAILFGANLSYATPMAYQTNLLVMNAAGYRFGDFVRVGTPLVLLMLVTLSFLLARHYGL